MTALQRMPESRAAPATVAVVSAAPLRRRVACNEIGFSAQERRQLMASPRIGAGVVARLESLGFHSMDAIRRVGVDAVIQAVCCATGGPAWGNRKRALAQALGLLEASRRPACSVGAVTETSASR